MKIKFWTLLHFFFFGAMLSYAQITLIPDSNFEQELITQGIDSDGIVNGQVFTADISVVGNLNISGKNISDLTGIEDFTSLAILRAFNNQITNANFTQNTSLEYLYIQSNQLTSIDLTQNTNLRIITINTNQLTTLDLSQSLSLEEVNASSNQINTIVLPQTTTLERVYLGDNQIISIDITTNTLLRELNIRRNQITDLDLSNHPNLVSVNVSRNNLSSFSIKNGNNTTLSQLNVTDNSNLTCIEVDDPNNIPSSGWQKDSGAFYASNCSSVILTINNAPSTTNGTNFTITINADRAITGLDIGDIVLTNATASNFNAISSTEYTVDIIATSVCSTDVTIDIPANSVLDSNNISNIALAQIIIATEDTTPPNIQLTTNNIILELDANGITRRLNVAEVDNGTTDNCSLDTWSFSKLQFNCNDLGQNTVTVSIDDGSPNFNQSSGTIIVSVEDNIPPIAIAQNTTIQLGANGQATIAGVDIDNGSTDNCSVNLSLSQSTFDCSNLGANTIILTATDSADNSDTASAVVTVEQNPNQQLTALAKDITVNLDTNGQAIITPQDVDDSSGSGCNSNPTLSLDKTTFNCDDVGQNTVTLTVTDATGTDTATATVTVEDSLTPTAITQDITLQLDANGQVPITVNDIDNGSSDNCLISSRAIDYNQFDCEDIGANTVTLTITDNSGNISTATAIVTIEDNIAPNVIAQDITVQLDASGQVVVRASALDNGSSDNCSIDNYTLNKSEFTCSNLGQNTVILSVQDNNGNIGTATAIITVEQNPNQQLTAIAKSITVELDANGQATITPQDVDDGSGSGCNSNPTLSIDITSFDCNNIGQNTVTLTATEGSNSSSATTIVTVEDNLASTVLTQDITVTLDTNGDASITTSDIDNGSTDNCAIDGLSLDTTTFTCSDLGDNTITLTVNDVNGNSATGTATVTITEDIAPTVLTQDITVTLDVNGEVSITAQDIDDGSSDSCSGIDTLSLDTTSFSCPELGDKTVTLTVTDNSGNSATGTATVTITSDDSDNDLIADVCDTKEITVVKGFSPNGDSIRDTWMIENIADFPRSHIQVFNRWGEKVFQATNYQNDWDGISNQGGGSKRLPVGPYLYIIELNEDGFMPVQGWLYINY